MNLKSRLHDIAVKVYNYLNTRSKIAKIILLMIPIIIYGMSLLRTGNKLPPGDGDYYIQLYEAARSTILDYRQLPWWNPWVSGGVPLFANPQFGPISIQLITSLFFGSVMGYKIALIIYLIVGFFGLRKLMTSYYKADLLHATLLSYIWVFSSFFVYRMSGHYTFFTVGFVPWILYFFLRRSDGRNWIWFSLFCSLLVWSSMHYTTILTFFIVGLFGLGELCIALIKRVKTKQSKKKINVINYIWNELHVKKLIYAAGLTVLLTFPRVFATLSYTVDYPRIQSFLAEETLSVDISWYALFGPDQYGTDVPVYGPWGWTEISTYIGFMTFAVLLICLYYFIQKTYKRTPLQFLLLFVLFFCLLVARADFASWSPFSLLREVPVFSSMRVASRWLAWAAIFILIFIATVKISNKSVKKVVTFMLLFSTLELFIVGFRNLDNVYFIPIADKHPEYSSTFTQRTYWNNKRNGVPYDENFTEATRNNIGQIYAGDSLIDTRPEHGALPTVRCDERVEGCRFISENAVIKEWTPNKIEIERLSEGPISVNINPSSYWYVNGVRNPSYKVVDPSKYFIIYDPSVNITLQYSPQLNPLSVLFERLF